MIVLLPVSVRNDMYYLVHKADLFLYFPGTKKRLQKTNCHRPEYLWWLVQEKSLQQQRFVNFNS